MGGRGLRVRQVFDWVARVVNLRWNCWLPLSAGAAKINYIDVRGSKGSAWCCNDGASYLQVGCESLRKPNKAPKFNSDGKLS